MALSDAELDRYARQIVLPQVGGVGQNRLNAASVAVVGAGGIGCAVIPALAGAGIGRLTIIDDDLVEAANLHRQPLFGEADVGQPKAELAAAYVARLNGFVSVTSVGQRITPDNAAAYIEYTVQKGDLLNNIAKKYNVTTKDILAINEISNADSLTVGQVLRIPKV